MLGLGVAILMVRKLKFESLYETLYFVPYILPLVPSVITWKWLFSSASNSPVNHFLHLINLPPVPWLSDPNICLLVICALHIWKHLGFFMIIFVVALKQIPQEIRECASIDGASMWQVVKNVEIPLVKPIILVGTVLGTIWAFSAFTEIFVMARGGFISTSAGTQVQLITYRIYKEAFFYHKLGYGSAQSTFLFVIALLLLFAQFKVFKE